MIYVDILRLRKSWQLAIAGPENPGNTKFHKMRADITGKPCGISISALCLISVDSNKLNDPFSEKDIGAFKLALKSLLSIASPEMYQGIELMWQNH